MIPWEELRPVIDSGIETLEVELKEKLDLDSATEKSNFIKDIAAMANIRGKIALLF